MFFNFYYCRYKTKVTIRDYVIVENGDYVIIRKAKSLLQNKFLL